MKYLLIAVGALSISPALADPHKDESGKGRFGIDHYQEYAQQRDWRDDRGRSSYRIPRGHLPPPGSCRVWFYDLPAGQQPPPTSCREAQRYAYRYGGQVIWGGGERH